VAEVGREEIAFAIIGERLEREVSVHLRLRLRRHLMDALQEEAFPLGVGEDDLDAERAFAGLHEGADRLEVLDPAEQGILDGVEQTRLADVIQAFDEVEPRHEAKRRVPIAAEVAQPNAFDHGASAAGASTVSGVAASLNAWAPASSAVINSPSRSRS